MNIWNGFGLPKGRGKGKSELDLDTQLVIIATLVDATPLKKCRGDWPAIFNI